MPLDQEPISTLLCVLLDHRGHVFSARVKRNDEDNLLVGAILSQRLEAEMIFGHLQKGRFGPGPDKRLLSILLTLKGS